MKLKLGFSTCPNDTFIFAPIVFKKIDTQGLDFELILADVEELNKMAFENSLDITKISFHAYAYLAKNFLILNSGSALGRNNGPLVIAKEIFPAKDLPQKKLAIPGKYTTANLLLQIAFGKLKQTKEYLFSEIPGAILNGEADAGVIIHETRFTYQDMGLKKIIDLGEFWEETTDLPVPLGGIIINRNLPEEVIVKFDRILKQSVLYSLENPQDSIDFIRKYAQEISDEVMYKHIELYVNDFTVDLGELGKKSIEKLYAIAFEKGLIPKVEDKIFV